MAAKRMHKQANRPSRRGTAEALRKALETLTRQDHGAATVTVSELCRLADVSRNSLYRYHAPILKTLREHQRRGGKLVQAKVRQLVVRRRAENIGLRGDVAKLAASVDYYYAAYRETSSLLERRDRELAELLNNARRRPWCCHLPIGHDREARLLPQPSGLALTATTLA